MSASMVVMVTRTGDTWNARLKNKPQVFGSGETIDWAVDDLAGKVSLPKSFLLAVSWKHSGGQPDPEKAVRGCLFQGEEEWVARVEGSEDSFGDCAFKAVEGLVQSGWPTSEFVLEYRIG